MFKRIKLSPLSLSIIVLCLVFDILVIYDVPLLRQVFGLIFIILLPGFLILIILNVKSDCLVTLVLSLGISISILMLFGLFLNNTLLLYDYEKPLSQNSLLISFNMMCITLLTIVVLLKRDNFDNLFFLNRPFEIFKLNMFDKAFLVLPFLFPGLSALGIHMVNSTNDNRMLFVLFYLISIYLILSYLYNMKFSNKFYPIFIYLISLSIIILLPLRSNNLIGVDTHVEYYFFQITLNNLYWKPFADATLDSTLSISLLPTIIQSMLNTSPEFLFRILYPIIYSISPLVIYLISKKYINNFYAFLASCFFMFQGIFIWTEYNARTNLAILFFALVVFVLFYDNLTYLQKKFLLILFTASCIVSHYSTTYIFFGLITLSYLIVHLFSLKYNIQKPITSSYVMSFFALIFLWYSLLTGAAFNSGVRFIKSIFFELNDFFIASSRDATTMSVLGSGIGQKYVPHKIEFIFTWIIFSLIAVGVITLITNSKKMSFPETFSEKSEFLNKKIDVTYSTFSVICVCFLILMVTLPFMSKGYGMERLYGFAIVTLSLFFIIGATILAKFIKINQSIMILLILIIYFFSITGITYNAFGVHRSILLNSDGEQYDAYYIHDQEKACAEWLKKYNEPRMIYTDFFGKRILLSQATYPHDLVDDGNPFNFNTTNGVVFLRSYNKNYGVLKSADRKTYNLTDIGSLQKSDLIYNNAAAEVCV